MLPRKLTVLSPDSCHLGTDHEEEMKVGTRNSETSQSNPFCESVLSTAKVNYSRWLKGKGRPGQPDLLEAKKQA